MRVQHIMIILLLLAANNIWGQDPNNHWQLGVSDVNFTNNPPVVTSTGNASQYGNASISDANGNLLFYTDGIKIFTKNHTIMQNGGNINSFYPSDPIIQPAIIVPNPAVIGQYYVFTSIVEHLLCLTCNELCQYKFSLVNFNNPAYPLGEVISSQFLSQNSGYFGPLTLVKNSTGDGYFVITQTPSAPGVTLNAYKLTSMGLDLNPISTYNSSDIGYANYTGSSPYNTSYGIIKFSPNGLKLGELVKTTFSMSPNVYGTSSRFVTFDFNNTTGTFSNYILVQNSSTFFNSGAITTTGIGYMTDFEFSNSSDKVYIISDKLYVKDLTNIATAPRVLSETGNSSSIPSLLKNIQRDKYDNILISSISTVNNQNKYIHKVYQQNSFASSSIDVNSISLNNNTIGYLPQYLPDLTSSTQCVPSLVITTNVTSGADNRQASSTIEALNMISSGAGAIYHAGNSVTLMPGFVANEGCTFHAYIAGCTNTYFKSISSINTASPIATEPEEKSKKDLILVAPNPNNGIFKIKLNDIPEGNIQIMDLKGLLVYKSSFEDQSELEIDIQDKPDGIYIVHVLFEGETYMARIVKNF